MAENKVPENQKNGSTIEQLVDPGNAYAPDVDIVENGEIMTLYVDLPGVAAGGAQVEVDENNILTLRARNSFREPEGRIFAQTRVGDYFRAFQLGGEYDRGRISAQLKDGVLVIRVPRKEETKIRRVEIKA